MNRTGRIILICVATALLLVAALASVGWAFDDANPVALALTAGAAWVFSQLP